LAVAVDTSKIKDDVVAGKRPATRLFLADVPEYVKEMTSQCWAQDTAARPAFSGKVAGPACVITGNAVASRPLGQVAGPLPDL